MWICKTATTNNVRRHNFVDVNGLNKTDAEIIASRKRTCVRVQFTFVHYLLQMFGGRNFVVAATVLRLSQSG